MEEKKAKAKKSFQILHIVFVILLAISVVLLCFSNHEMYKILNQEAEDNEEFWDLKVAIAKCYLSEKKSLFGNNTELYQKYLYSSNCDAGINKVKWVATGIEIRGGQFNYEGDISIGIKEKIPIRVNNALLEQIIDNQYSGSEELVFYTEPDLVMYYSMEEEIFIVEYIY